MATEEELNPVVIEADANAGWRPVLYGGTERARALAERKLADLVGFYDWLDSSSRPEVACAVYREIAIAANREAST